MKKLNQKETPIQNQVLLAAWLINEPYSVLLLCRVPCNETHRVSGCSAAGFSKTRAGVCLNEVLMGRQVHVAPEGRAQERPGERAEQRPQGAVTAVRELSANCAVAFDTGKLDLKDFFYSETFSVVTYPCNGRGWHEENSKDNSCFFMHLAIRVFLAITAESLPQINHWILTWCMCLGTQVWGGHISTCPAQKAFIWLFL